MGQETLHIISSVTMFEGIGGLGGAVTALQCHVLHANQFDAV